MRASSVIIWALRKWYIPKARAHWRWWMRRSLEVVMKLLLNTFLLVSFSVPVVSVNALAEEKSKESPPPVTIPAGRALFLKNCAHCHADDAKGDEGPDLHGLKRSDEWISRRIRNGVK